MKDGGLRRPHERARRRMEREGLSEASKRVASAPRVVALTGAGISEESGIPTFRGKGGLWDRYPPERFARISGLITEFLIHPERVAGFLREILQSCLEAKPNPAHLALARWEAEGRLRAVITQNIDTLHERAGSRRVFKLHGSIDRLRCEDCRFRQDFDEGELRRWVMALSAEGMGRRQLWHTVKGILTPCPYCGGRRRPDVVLFGDLLPQDAWLEARREAASCQVLVVVGTSGLVHPAAQIPLLAKEAGAVLIEVNPQPTSLTPHADIFLAGKAGQVMEELAGCIQEDKK